MKKMKVMLVLAAVSAMLICACGSSNDTAGDSAVTGQTDTDEAGGTDASATGDESTAATDASAETPSGYYVSVNGVNVYANAGMAAIEEALGEPTSYFESESCAFQGLDKTYTYGSVVITTYPVDGVDYVYTIELKDDTVETAEGVCIGSTKDDVTASYGTATSETDTALSYEKDDCVLAFIFDGDSVSNITYTAVTE